MVERIEEQLTRATEKRVQYKEQINKINKCIGTARKQITVNIEKIERLQLKAKRLY